MRSSLSFLLCVILFIQGVSIALAYGSRHTTPSPYRGGQYPTQSYTRHPTARPVYVSIPTARPVGGYQPYGTVRPASYPTVRPISYSSYPTARPSYYDPYSSVRTTGRPYRQY